MKKTILKFLSNLESDYNKLPHPIYLIFYGAIIIIALSAFLATRQPEVFSYINPNSLEVVERTTQVTSAFSADAYFKVFLEAVDNFTNYPIYPLIIVTLIGFSIAEKSGMLYTVFKKLALRVPKRVFTYIIVIIGVLSNLLSPNILNAGYIVLLPLSAFVYMGKGRNPLAGIATAFAALFAGYQLNMFYDNIYLRLTDITEKAASLVVFDYEIPYYATDLFMFVATIVTIFTIVFVSEKIIVPFCRESKTHTYTDDNITSLERSGLIVTIFMFFIIAAIYVFMLIPSHQVDGAGLLLGTYDPIKTTYINQFIKSPFVHSLAVHIAVVLSILGVTFGIASKRIKSANDVVEFIVSSISEYAEYILIIFLFSQLGALLDYTNLAEYFVVLVANYIQNSSFEGITLVYVIITLTFIVNFFMPLSIDKWSYLAPAVVPSVMAFSFTPSLGQIAYIIGDTTANTLTPFMPYTLFAYALFRVYGKKTKQEVGIGTSLSLTLPFSLIMMFILFIMITIWISFLLPLGEVSVFL